MSQFYDQASLVMVPSGYKAGKVYSQKPLSTDGELTFTRNSNATRVNSAGKVEKVRTNLALQSQTFDNASWIKASATITANATTAPDGTLTADKLVANSGYNPTSATGNLNQTNVVTSNIHTISLYAKAAEFTSIRFRENFSVGSFLTIDLTNGSITGAGSQYINPTATAVGDGWYRISFVTPATADLGKYSIRVANTGDGTSGVFIWGLQFEVSDFGPTDYIATTSTAVSVGPVSGLPRLDYSGGASCPSLLLEPQRTNLLTYSEQFDNAAWNKTTGVILTPNAEISPDGYQNADYIQMGGANRLISQATSLSIGVTCTASVYIKGTAGKTIKIAAGGADSANIVLTGEWQRINHTATSISNGININTFGGATARNFYLWGAQLEAGSYATSYIPTLGASVTRLADAAYKTGIASLIGQSEGTIFLDYEKNKSSIGEPIWLSDGTYNQFIYLSEGSNITFIGVRYGSQWSIPSGTLANGRHKIAAAYKQNDIVLYIDGVQIGTDTSANVPNCSLLGLGYENGTIYNNANPYKQVLLFKTRLSNQQLAEITAL